jgi:hypothetical protein
MAPRVPKIGKGVKVVTKKKPVRHGTVVAAVGPRTWTVEFAAEGGVKTVEQLSSAQLGVYKEYYNKHSSTPVRSALKTLRKAVRETVGRPCRSRQIQSSASSIASNSISSSSESNQRDRDDDDFVLDPNKETSPSDVESPTLLTPRPLSSPVVLPRSRQLFASEFEVEVVVEDVSDDESAGSFDDVLEEDEDPDGTDQLQVITPTEDGGEQVEFRDRLMKKAAYENFREEASD